MLRAIGTQLALVGVALLGACVSFPEVTGGADSTSSGPGGGGSGAGTTTMTGTGAGNSVSSSSGEGGGGGSAPEGCQTIEMGGPDLGCLQVLNDDYATWMAEGGAASYALAQTGSNLSWYNENRGYFASTQVTGDFAVVLGVAVDLSAGVTDPSTVIQMAGLVLSSGDVDWVKWEIGYPTFGAISYFGAVTREAVTFPLEDYPTPAPAEGQTVALGACRAGGSVYLKHNAGGGWSDIDHTLLNGGGDTVESFDISDFGEAFDIGFTVHGFTGAPRLRASVDYLRFAETSVTAETCNDVLEALRTTTSCPACAN